MSRGTNKNVLMEPTLEPSVFQVTLKPATGEIKPATGNFNGKFYFSREFIHKKFVCKELFPSEHECARNK